MATMTRREAEQAARALGHDLGPWRDVALVGEPPAYVSRCHMPRCGAYLSDFLSGTITGSARRLPCPYRDPLSRPDD